MRPNVWIRNSLFLTALLAATPALASSHTMLDQFSHSSSFLLALLGLIVGLVAAINMKAALKVALITLAITAWFGLGLATKVMYSPAISLAVCAGVIGYFGAKKSLTGVLAAIIFTGLLASSHITDATHPAGNNHDTDHHD